MDSSTIKDYGTLLAIIVAGAIQFFANRKAKLAREAIAVSLIANRELVDAKMNIIAATSNGTFLALLKDRTHIASMLAQSQNSPMAWQIYEACKQAEVQYEERNRQLLLAIEKQPPVEMAHNKADLSCVPKGAQIESKP